MLQLVENTKLRMTVGRYVIDISYQGRPSEKYSLPDCVRQFCNEDDPEEGADISYDIPAAAIHNPACLSIPDAPAVAGFADGPYPYEIYRIPSGDYLWLRGDKAGGVLLAYEISKDWSRWQLLADQTGTAGWDSFQELAYLFPYSILNKGGILFHGVVMEWEGSGIVIGAHSGVGKTTHAKLWQKYEEVLILNGDRALCRREEDRWYTYGAPWYGSSGDYLNRRTALAAIVIIEQAPDNIAEQLAPLQGALELIQLAFAPSFDKLLTEYTLQAIDSLVRHIPVIRLRCRPEREAVEVLKNRIDKILKLQNTDVGLGMGGMVYDKSNPSTRIQSGVFHRNQGSLKTGASGKAYGKR